MWRINATISQLPMSRLTSVSMELVRSDNGLIYALACLFAFLTFGLAYFIVFRWVAKGNLDMPRFEDSELQIRNRKVFRPME